MDIKKILSKIIWPLKKLDEETSELVAEKSAVAVHAALSEVPIVQSLLNGEEVTLEVKLKLKAPVA